MRYLPHFFSLTLPMACLAVFSSACAPIEADLPAPVQQAQDSNTPTPDVSPEIAIPTEITVYDGENVPFALATAWDQHESTIQESSESPHSGQNHLRATLNVQRFWGGAAYAFNHWSPQDWSPYTQLQFYGKIDKPTNVYFWLVDATGKQSSKSTTVPMSTTYEAHSIPLVSLGQGVDLWRVSAIVISLSEFGEQTYTIDLDDLVVNGMQEVEPGQDIEADHPNIMLSGRWDTNQVKAPTSTWGATTIRARFTGSRIAVRLIDGNNNWTYSIDNGPMQTLVTNGRTAHSLATELAEGEHSLIMTRKTEAYFGSVTFAGFIIDAGAELLPLEKPPTRKMEFIGDSITAGYGNEGFYQDRATQNGYMAYGPQAARILDADWHVQAISGIGMYRNYGDSKTYSDITMRDYVQRTHPYQETSVWNYSQWNPDVLIVALGTNDFMDGSVDRDGFRQAYTDFLQTMRGHYPNAAIFCISPYFSVEPFITARQDIQAAIDATGDANIYHLDPVGDTAQADNVTTRPWLDGPQGSDYIGDWTHPTVDGHTKIADKLAAEVRDKLGW